MKRLAWLVVVALVAAGCTSSEMATEGALVDLASASPVAFVAPLSGAAEVPANDSRARGQAVFRLNEDRTELSYRLIVANIENVRMAHIHLAPAGSNGPVVAWLYPDGPPAQLIPGRSQGVLAEGVLTGDRLLGLLAGASISDLVDQIEAGNAYVNVHTDQFPPGEVRGQIR
jgi:hypothetical protein